VHMSRSDEGTDDLIRLFKFAFYSPESAPSLLGSISAQLDGDAVRLGGGAHSGRFHAGDLPTLTRPSFEASSGAADDRGRTATARLSGEQTRAV
jgi:hypothetical protein